MVRFINKLTGGDMWVAEPRVAEYLTAGHKLAVEVPAAPAVEKPAVPPKKRKTTTKK